MAVVLHLHQWKMNKFLAVNVVVLVITMVKHAKSVWGLDIIITRMKEVKHLLLLVVDIDAEQEAVIVLFQGGELDNAGLNTCGCGDPTEWHF